MGAKKGHVVLEETRKKIGLANSLSLLGKKQSEETKEKRRQKCRITSLGNKNALGYKWTQEHKDKFRLAQLGEKSNNWRGGIYPFSKGRLRQSPWKSIAENIRLRDSNTCQICGVKSNKRKFDVHHIVPYRLTENNSDENLITLCPICHMKEERTFELQMQFLKLLMGGV